MLSPNPAESLGFYCQKTQQNRAYFSYVVTPAGLDASFPFSSLRSQTAAKPSQSYNGLFGESQTEQILSLFRARSYTVQAVQTERPGDYHAWDEMRDR
jgi:hypothetical protein